MFNHVEYDALSLRDEFLRDRDRIDAPFPRHYFPGDNPAAEPRNSWRSHAHLLFGNWINEIYQTIPFDTLT
jgi:homoserine O-succinyltransferase/O-acetyltransferase